MRVLVSEGIYLFMDISYLETATITVKAVPGKQLNNGKMFRSTSSNRAHFRIDAPQRMCTLTKYVSAHWFIVG